MAGDRGLPTVIPSKRCSDMPAGSRIHRQWLAPVICILQGGLGAFRSSFQFKVCLHTVCGVLLAVAFLTGWHRRRARGSPRQAAITVCLDEPQVTKKVQKILCFNRTVKGICFPSVACLDKEEKSKLYWQSEDFTEFLRVRMLIGRAYHAVAKRRGVAVDSEFPAEPVLAHESRLGLCLGRQQERLQARKNYVAEVLKEQARQLGLDASTSDGSKQSGECVVADVLDHELLARAARCASKHDGVCSVEQGVRLHQRVMKDLEEREPRRVTRRRTTWTEKKPRPQDLEEEEPPNASRDVSEGTTDCSTVSCKAHFGADVSDEKASRFNELVLSPRCLPRRRSNPCQLEGQPQGEASPPAPRLPGTSAPDATMSRLNLPVLPLAALKGNARGTDQSNKKMHRLQVPALSPGDILKADTRGFGLSREMLEQSGLSPNGSLLVKHWAKPSRCTLQVDVDSEQGSSSSRSSSKSSCSSRSSHCSFCRSTTEEADPTEVETHLDASLVMAFAPQACGYALPGDSACNGDCELSARAD